MFLSSKALNLCWEEFNLLGEDSSSLWISLTLKKKNIYGKIFGQNFKNGGQNHKMVKFLGEKNLEKKFKKKKKNTDFKVFFSFGIIFLRRWSAKTIHQFYFIGKVASGQIYFELAVLLKNL